MNEHTWDWIMDISQTKAQLKARAHDRHASRTAITISLLLAILALTIAAYPFISQAVGDQTLQNTANQTLKPTPQDQRMTRAAQTYNQRLWIQRQPVLGGIQDPMSGSTDFTGDKDPDYNQLLNTDGLGIMGSILIPRISVNLPIYHGATTDVLAHGIGHLPGSSLPVGGTNTRTVLTGHSNMRDATLFTRLPELTEGDPIYLTVAGRTLAYRVTGSQIVDPTDVNALRIRKGRDLVTLVTCTGMGNTKRLLVTAERNHMPDQVPYPWNAPKDRTRAWETAIGVTLATMLIGVTVILTAHRNRMFNQPHHLTERNNQ